MSTTALSVFAKRELFVNEIVFYAKNEVSLFGFIHDGGKFHETQFIISRNHLQMLLSQSKTGIEILWQIEKLFVLPHAVPASLNLIELFGTTQVLESCKIEFDIHCCECEDAESIPSGRYKILFVEDVVPFAKGESKKFGH